MNQNLKKTQKQCLYDKFYIISVFIQNIMKKALSLLLIMLSLSTAFAPGMNIWTAGDNVSPMKLMCEELQNVTFNFDKPEFQGTKYENMTEFPPELLDYLNEQIKSDDTATKAMSKISNTTFSMEILYNNTNCLSASFKINKDSELEFFKLESDELAGTSDEHVLFHFELYSLEEVMIGLAEIQTGKDFNPLNIIGLFFKSVWTILTSIIGKDIYVQPVTGFRKAFEALNVVLSKSFQDIEGNFSNAMLTQAV